MKINVVFEITMNTCSYNKGGVCVEIWVEGEKVIGKVGENVIYATMPTIDSCFSIHCWLDSNSVGLHVL